MKKTLFVIVILLLTTSISIAQVNEESSEEKLEETEQPADEGVTEESEIEEVVPEGELKQDILKTDWSLILKERPRDETRMIGDWKPEVEIDVSKPLSLNQCINIALERSSRIKQANLSLKSVALNLADAWAKYLPGIDIGGQYQYSKSGADSDMPGREPDRYNVQVSASYTIWDHNRRQIQLGQAKAEEKASQADYDKTTQDLIFSITEAYYNLLQAEKLVGVNERLLEISKGTVEKVKTFQEQGKAIPADLASAMVQQASDESNLINAQNNLEIARARLASLMGLNPGAYIQVEDDPDFRIYVSASLVTREVSLENSMSKAFEKRPELNRLQYRLKSLDLSLKQAKWDRWPILTSEYGYNITLDEYLKDMDNFNKYRDWSVGIRVSFPIFDGGTSKRRMEKAEIALEQMIESISEQERSIILEVEQSYLDLEKSKKNLDIAKIQVENATESLNVIQERYGLGMVIFLEVLSAQARYAQSLINQVRAFYDYKSAEKSLQKAIGTLKAEE